MQSLLSPSEYNDFHSFLSIVDYPDDALTPSEWQKLTAGSSSSQVVDHVPEHREALAKAARDLMSLEPDRWRSEPLATQRAVEPHKSLAASQDRFHALQRQHQYLNTSESLPQAEIQDYLAQDPSLCINGAKLSSTKQASSHRTTRQSSNPSSKRSPTSTSSPSSTSTATPTPKQNLLSPSQKKANHIQSEQKRRANIRRGYDALCETVPALQEAIRQEEDEAAVMAERNGASGRKRRKKASTNGKDGTGGDKEKMDGRAGPRSENVVLMKSESFFSLQYAI